MSASSVLAPTPGSPESKLLARMAEHMRPANSGAEMATITHPPRYADTAPQLVGNGWEPLPINPETKRPLVPDWTIREIPLVDYEYIDKQGAACTDLVIRYRAWDVGIRCGGKNGPTMCPSVSFDPRAIVVNGIDVDVKNPTASAAVEAYLRERFTSNGTFLKRTGQAPKFLVPVRCIGQGAKITGTGFSFPEGSNQKVEILRTGQQFVAFGTHTKTGQPYTWDGGSPLNVSVVELPQVTEADLREIVGQIENILHCHCKRANASSPKAPVVDIFAEIATQYQALRGMQQPKPRDGMGVSPRSANVIAEGSRNEALYKLGCSMRAKAFGEKAILAALLEENREKCAPPLSDAEITTIARQCSRHPEGLPGGESNFEGALGERGDYREELFDREWFQRRFRAATDIINDPVRAAWTVRKVLPHQGITTLFGRWSTFKSFLALDLALHIATGKDWCGHGVRPGAVLYCSAEGQGMARRIAAWLTHHNAQSAGIDGSFFLFEGVVALNNRAIANACAEAIEHRAAEAGAELQLVVIDTFSQYAALENENDNSEVATFIRMIGLGLRQRLKCSVLLVHHSGHGDQDRSRGASAIEANVDASIKVTRPDDSMNYVTLTHAKAPKDGERMAPVGLEGRVVRLAHLPQFNDEPDIDFPAGKPTSSLVFVPTAVRSSPPKLRANQLIVFDAVRGAGNRGITVGDLKAAKLPDDNGKPIRSDNLERTLDVLERHGYVTVDADPSCERNKRRVFESA